MLVIHPKFTSPPSPQSVGIAQTATFTCSAAGHDVKYQWTIGSGSFPSKVTGINTNTLEIPDVGPSDNNAYCCTISNDGGSVTSDPVQLTVIGMSTLPTVVTIHWTGTLDYIFCTFILGKLCLAFREPLTHC